MIKAVLTLSSAILISILTSGCGGLITKPIGLATKAVLSPVKVVAGATVDVVGKPLRKTAQLVKPVTPIIRVR